MSRTVLLIVNAKGESIVDNVIKLAPYVPYDPGPGVSMLPVSEYTQVGPGMRLVAGSSPPEFEHVAVEDQPDLPASQSDAIASARALVQQAMDMLDRAEAIG